MSFGLIRVAPKVLPPLDPEFRPAYLGNQNFEKRCKDSGQAVKMVFALEGAGGSVTRFETVAYPSEHPLADANAGYAERIVKFLLWSRGGWKLSVAGPKEVVRHLQIDYAPK